MRRGEILGLAGLIGAGRTELARASSASTARSAARSGSTGATVAIGSPRDAIAQGIYLVPEDRKAAGVVLDFSVAAEHLAAAAAGARRGSGWSAARRRTRWPRPSGAGSASARPDVGTLVGTLSGGNQQKVVLAKWLAMRPKAIIFDEPTRGIDVGAKREIYDILRAARRRRASRS